MPTDIEAKKVAAAKQELTIHLPDTRGVEISRWGRGNTKLGIDVMTYSRLPGRPDGLFEDWAQQQGFDPGASTGTCPGSTSDCEAICYAKRVINTPPVWDVWAHNTGRDDLPDEPLPHGTQIVRIHVSGDFDTVAYIEGWIRLVDQYPHIRFFGYTRSWRVSKLRESIERLRDLPNVQLFASVDKSMTDLPNDDWRRAWLESDVRSYKGGGPGFEQGLDFWIGEGQQNFITVDDKSAYVCPEQTGRKPDCQSCNYCIKGTSGDVIFLVH